MRLLIVLVLVPALGGCRTRSIPPSPGPSAPSVAAPDELSAGWWRDVRPRLVRAAKAEAKAGAGTRRVAWEFRIRPGSGPNAVSWPDGRVAVTRGLLAFVRSEDELAAVLAHEMVHVLEGHGWKRLAGGWLTLLGGTALALAVAENSGGAEAAAAGGALVGTVSLAALLPMSRAHELEADVDSLRILRRAGYDPHASLRFWKRYAKWREAAGRSLRPSALSAHPPDSRRLDSLRLALQRIDAESATAPHAPKTEAGAKR